MQLTKCDAVVTEVVYSIDMTSRNFVNSAVCDDDNDIVIDDCDPAACIYIRYYLNQFYWWELRQYLMKFLWFGRSMVSVWRNRMAYGAALRAIWKFSFGWIHQGCSLFHNIRSRIASADDESQWGNSDIQMKSQFQASCTIDRSIDRPKPNSQIVTRWRAIRAFNPISIQYSIHSARLITANGLPYRSRRPIDPFSLHKWFLLSLCVSPSTNPLLFGVVDQFRCSACGRKCILDVSVLNTIQVGIEEI